MEEKRIRHTIKDNIFRDMFSDIRFMYELYQALHPEDKETLQDDLKLETLESIIYNGQHNDLGFSVKDKMIILVEAQVTWSYNILIRFLEYLAGTYHKYFTDRGESLYDGKKVQCPKPELYMIYTGDKGSLPDTISLRKEFFGGEPCCIEVEAKVIYMDYSHTIIDQYIQFCRVLAQQRKIYGDTPKAIEETLRICRDKDLLQAYLKGRESEVIDMMMALFDQETQDRLWENEKENEIRTRVLAEGEARGEARGKAEGKAESFWSLVQDEIITKATAAKKMGISVAEFDKLCEEYAFAK